MTQWQRSSAIQNPVAIGMSTAQQATRSNEAPRPPLAAAAIAAHSCCGCCCCCRSAVLLAFTAALVPATPPSSSSFFSRSSSMATRLTISPTQLPRSIQSSARAAGPIASTSSRMCTPSQTISAARTSGIDLSSWSSPFQTLENLQQDACLHR